MVEMFCAFICISLIDLQMYWLFSCDVNYNAVGVRAGYQFTQSMS